MAGTRTAVLYADGGQGYDVAGVNAEVQAAWAKIQGDYAKAQGDAIGDISEAVETTAQNADDAQESAALAQTIRDTLVQVLVSISARSGWLFPFTDNQGNIVGGFKLDTSLVTARSGNIDDLLATIITQIATVVANSPKTISNRAGWLDVFTDVAGNILLGIKKDTSLVTARSGNIDDLLVFVQARLIEVAAGAPISLSKRAGWLFVFTDNAKNILFGARNSGDFYVGEFNISAFMRAGGIGDTIASLLYPTPDIYIPGDSMTENWATFAADMQTALTAAGDTTSRTFTKSGLGGQLGSQILGRYGARPPMVTFPNGASGLPEIPASGAVGVILNTGILDHPGSGNAEQQTLLGTIQVGLGAYGTLTRLAGGTTYQFTRSVTGSIIVVPPRVAFISDNLINRQKTAICWIATNDLNTGSTADTIFGMIEDFQRGQVTQTKRIPIVMPTWDFSATNRRATYDALYTMLVGKYGAWVIDTIGELAPYNSGSANDLADIAAGFTPRSLLKSDRLHYETTPNTAYSVIAGCIARTIKRNG